MKDRIFVDDFAILGYCVWYSKKQSEGTVSIIEINVVLAIYSSKIGGDERT